LERQQLNELLAELADDLPSVHNDPVELQVIIAWLEGAVSEQKSANGFLRGQLTFCSMLPMRSIPFKIIALMGMNDGDFPKVDRQPTFDLMAKDFREGDRSRRADDRYQFLEVLLSARQQLIVTFIGQSQANNDRIPPSVVISELLSVLEDHYQLKDWITYQPLQAFSPRNFDGESALFSFSETHLETAKALAGKTDAPDIWWQGELPETEPGGVIEVAELLSFFQHPQRYFVQRQLGLRFTGLEADAEEREPFAVSKLEGYAISHDWIQHKLDGTDLAVNKLKAQGLWPSGAPGYLAFQREEQNIAAFAQQIQAKGLGKAIDDLPVDLEIEGYRLIGKLGKRYENGSLYYRYATLKGKDFMGAWLHHLIINQVQPQATYLISSDEDLVFLPEDIRPEDLPQCLAIYRQGLQRPDAFFVEAALAYLKQAHKQAHSKRATKPALVAAKEQLQSAIESGYEPELSRLYGEADLDVLLGEALEQQCRELLQRLWDAVQQRT
jgi:exodeoxyribonuclease V gamma subunit